MIVYTGDYARLYDLFYADKAYDDEVIFVDRLLRERAQGPSRRLLDVACGTGRHTVGFADLDWDAVGVDRSADMLSRARERMGQRHVSFVEHDMQRLDLPSKDFDAAVCLFDSIGYGVTNDAILDTLVGVRRHLRPNGLFVVEFWHAAPMLREHDPVRVRQWEMPGAQILRLSRTTLDIVRQVARVEYTVYQFNNDSTFSLWSEVHENRYFLVQEMGLLLNTAGLKPIDWFAGFDAARPIDDSTWHILALCRARVDAP